MILIGAIKKVTGQALELDDFWKSPYNELTAAHVSTGMRRRGLMLALSSPSGAGKTTLARKLVTNDSHLFNSVSVTTRPPRPGEVHGRDYYFVDKNQFDQLAENRGLLEYAKVFGHYYGTPKQPVESALVSGRDVMFDIDWQGTQQIAQIARHDLVSVFILPPSYEELERRLRSRAEDPEEVILKRMAEASSEMSHWGEYEYVIINKELDESLYRLQAILQAERLKRERLVGLSEFVKTLRPDEEV